MLSVFVVGAALDSFSFNPVSWSLRAATDPRAALAGAERSSPSLVFCNFFSAASVFDISPVIFSYCLTSPS
jgi:hypothetical protein